MLALPTLALGLEVDVAALAVVDPSHQTLALEACDGGRAEVHHGDDLPALQVRGVVVVGQSGGGPQYLRSEVDLEG